MSDATITVKAVTQSVTVTGLPGVQGVKGDPGQGAAIVCAFAWDDVYPKHIINMPAGKRTFKVEVYMSAAFDQPSTLTVGDSANNARLLSSDDIDLSLLDDFQAHPKHVYSEITTVNAYLSPGAGNSSGGGLLLLYIQD